MELRGQVRSQVQLGNEGYMVTLSVLPLIPSWFPSANISLIW